MVDLKLKDNEVQLIINHIFQIKLSYKSVSINLENNLINGSCIIRLMEDYINKYNHFALINLKFGSNPITKENYSKFIQLLS